MLPYAQIVFFFYGHESTVRVIDISESTVKVWSLFWLREYFKLQYSRGTIFLAESTVKVFLKVTLLSRSQFFLGPRVL